MNLVTSGLSVRFWPAVVRRHSPCASSCHDPMRAGRASILMTPAVGLYLLVSPLGLSSQLVGVRDFWRKAKSELRVGRRMNLSQIEVLHVYNWAFTLPQFVQENWSVACKNSINVRGCVFGIRKVEVMKENTKLFLHVQMWHKLNYDPI